WLTRFKRIAATLVVLLFGVITIALGFVWDAQRKEAVAKQDAIQKRDIAVKAERVAEQARGEESKQRANAEKQTEIALAQKKEADRQRGLAEDATKEALDQKGKAETARGIAVQKESEAVESQKREELAAYGARIGMAAAKVEENAFDTADRLLADCKP